MKVSEKKQIVSELAKESRINKEQADFVYDVLMDILSRRIQSGKDVYLRGIGRITSVKSKGVRSNLTGVSIPNHKRIAFYPNCQLARTIRVETREHPIKS
jgi:nucleoid DNA-binding protein